MPVDDRIRHGLRRSAAAVPVHAERALQETLERARRRSRRRRVAAVGVGVVAVVVAVAVPRPGGQPDRVTAPPADTAARLVGSWAAQVAPGSREASAAALAGSWTLTFTADGALIVTPPGAYAGTLAGVRYRVVGDELRTDVLGNDTCAGSGGGTYRLGVDAGRLAFHPVSERCSARRVLLSGQDWVPSRPGASCVNNGGGACLGDLAAGTYRTTRFRPQVRYTVPMGWTNSQDLPGNLLLQPAGGDERYVGIYRNATVPDRCHDRAAPGVGTSVEAIADWLSHHPGLDASAAQPVTVGGLQGVRMDVALRWDWRQTCEFSAGRPVVAFLYGGGPSVLHHVLLPGFTERLYLLTVPGGGNVTIEVAPEGRSLRELVAAAGPLLTALRFGAG